MKRRILAAGALALAVASRWRGTETGAFASRPAPTKLLARPSRPPAIGAAPRDDGSDSGDEGDGDDGDDDERSYG